jgi:hypothetical protein
MCVAPSLITVSTLTPATISTIFLEAAVKAPFSTVWQSHHIPPPKEK